MVPQPGPPSYRPLKIMLTPASHVIMKEFEVDGDDLIVDCNLLVERELMDEVFILDCSEKVERIQE